MNKVNKHTSRVSWKNWSKTVREKVKGERNYRKKWTIKEKIWKINGRTRDSHSYKEVLLESKCEVKTLKKDLKNSDQRHKIYKKQKDKQSYFEKCRKVTQVEKQLKSDKAKVQGEGDCGCRKKMQNL